MSRRLVSLFAESYHERKEVIRLKMVKRVHIFLLATALLTAGCASKWAMEIQHPTSRIQWPPAPNEARVQQVMTIRGFKETGTSLKTIVFGRGAEKIAQPIAVATGRDGRIAIASADCQCVHLYVPSEERHQKLSSADKEMFISPVGLAFDEELRLYIADSGSGKLFSFDSRGQYLSSFGNVDGTVFQRPTGLAYNTAGRLLYVVDTVAQKIYAIDKQGKTVFSFGERGKEKGQFNFPTHIFWSPAGRIYVTDALNFRIQIFDSLGNFVAAFGHHGVGSGDFAMPKGVVADRDGVIFIVDSLFDNIQLFNEQGDFLLTVGNRGGGPAEFWLPSGMFLDEKKRLFVCDTYNQRVQVFEIMGGNR